MRDDLTDKNSDTLNRTATASFAMGSAQFVAKLIDLSLILILARLLTPEDFALIAIAMVFVQVTEAILEMPVGQVLVRANRVTRDMLYTAFSIALVRSAIVVVVILSLTPVVAIAFKDDRLYVLMPVLAMGPALRSLLNPKMVLFARRLNFFPDAVIAVSARLCVAFIAIPVAFIIKSYWALAIVSVLSPTFLLLFTYLYLPFVPKVSFQSWRMFVNMIGWTTVAQLFNAANWQSSVLVLAQLSSRTTTGNYSVASNMAGTAYQIFISPVLRPFITSFSELKRLGQLTDQYLLAMRSVFVLSTPIFLGIALLSDHVILLLFGAEWTQAHIFLSVLLISTIIGLPGIVATSVAYALDRTVYFAAHAFVSFSVVIVATILGFHLYGLPGFLAGHIIAAIVSYCFALFMVKRLIGISFKNQTQVLIHPVLSLAIMGVCVHYLSGLVVDSSIFLYVPTLGAVSLCGATIYIASTYLLWFARGKPDGLENRVATFTIAFWKKRFGRPND